MRHHNSTNFSLLAHDRHMSRVMTFLFSRELVFPRTNATAKKDWRWHEIRALTYDRAAKKAYRVIWCQHLIPCSGRGTAAGRKIPAMCRFTCITFLVFLCVNVLEGSVVVGRDGLRVGAGTRIEIRPVMLRLKGGKDDAAPSSSSSSNAPVCPHKLMMHICMHAYELIHQFRTLTDVRFNRAAHMHILYSFSHTTCFAHCPFPIFTQVRSGSFT